MGLSCFEPKGAFYVFPNIKKFGMSQGYKNVNQLVLGLINEKMEQVGYEERIPVGIREVKAKNVEDDKE